MTTGAYRQECRDLLGAGVLGHTAAAVLVDGSQTGLALPLLGGRVEFDEDRSPRITASLDLALDSPVTYEQLDPRLPASVVVYAGYRHPAGWSSVGQLLDGVVTDREAARPDDTVRVGLASTERVAIDYGTAKPGTTVDVGSWRGAYQRAVALAFGGNGTGDTPPTWDTTAPGTVPYNLFPAPAQPDLTNRDLWSIIQDAADQAGADVYDRGDRVWQFTYRVATTGTPRLVLSAAAGTVTGSRVRTSRADGYANRVVLVHEWLNAAGASLRVQSTRDVTGGPFKVAAGNVVTHRDVRDVPTTQTAANNAAAALVRRLAHRGLFYEVTGPAAYWLRPGDTVTLDLPAGGDADVIVSRVVFDLSTGVMDLSLRPPDGATTVGAPV